MFFEKIKPGDRVEITCMIEATKDRKFNSLVEHIEGERKLLILMPIEKGYPVKLPISDKYTMLFITDKGTNRFLFDATVDGYGQVDKFGVLYVTLTSEGRKVQQREFFRVACMMPFRFTEVDQENVEIDASVSHEGIVRDLSGGGMRFITRVELHHESRVRVALMLEKEYIIVFGTIMLKNRIDLRGYRYEYHVKFTAVPDADQEKIVRYVYAEQRKSLKRGR